ncbi:hypothetical protein K493DRAFT_357319 [Basidiobolus meristosporus CBS 931.73]|uniref:SH3 domain-containing protein n=1 Tax=Basidiobolus meristosporus CBS 931.73 TaxID=1314790 RepID=A0A1Y1XXJ8_9FUNG|nr:hypothetical protein K493DRAFT_357319 [Basidiobolus meristosporus CBS 931.73]|eukprot:ORX90074.1 hypothetical protein K493DRAFT_357319 [Basidiobolus meristosporus CBS 931.73]
MKPATPFGVRSIPAPKRYVKALFSYHTPLDESFTFQAGEVLYVVGQENDKDWWVVCNPLTKKSGLVPVQFLEVIPNTGPAHNRQASQRKEPPKTVVNSRKRGISNAQAALCGEVRRDFAAKTAEQLSVAAGEIVTIVSSPASGWILAKPTGKSVTPGWIPHSCVHIYDSFSGEKVTDVSSRLPKPTPIKQQVIRSERSPVLSASVCRYRLVGKESEYDLLVTLSKAPYSRKLVKSYQQFREFHLGLLRLFSDSRSCKIPSLPVLDVAHSVEEARQMMPRLTTYLVGVCQILSDSDGCYFIERFLDEAPSELTERPPNKPTPNSNAKLFSKVKVVHGPDIIIIRVPLEISFSELKKKVTTRLEKIQSLHYRDTQLGTNFEICTDNELRMAWGQTFQKNATKLLLYAM